MSGLLGKKIGMTRIFDNIGNIVPVTVIKAGPCFVTQIKTSDKDGYNSVSLGYDIKKEKNTTKPLLGYFKKAEVPPVRIIKEFPPFKDQELKKGDQLMVDIFKAGDKVKISGTSKGRGFAGVVKRWGFKGGPVTHGQSDRLRAPGSLGQSSDPSRVFKGIKMGGHMGNKRVSFKNILVVKVDSEKNLLYVKGSIPGARNNFVEIFKA